MISSHRRLLLPSSQKAMVSCIINVNIRRDCLPSSSFHRLDMTLAVAEALNPNKPNPLMEEIALRNIVNPINITKTISGI